MTKDHARLTVLMDADRKKQFDELCASLGTNASEVVRALIVKYLAEGQPEPSLLPADATRHGRKPPTRGK